MFGANDTSLHDLQFYVWLVTDVAVARAVIHRFRATCAHAVAIHGPANATRFPCRAAR